MGIVSHKNPSGWLDEDVCRRRAYHLMTPLPQFLTRNCLEVFSNVHQFVVKVLDCRVLLSGVVGRRVQGTAKVRM